MLSEMAISDVAIFVSMAAALSSAVYTLIIHRFATISCLLARTEKALNDVDYKAYDTYCSRAK